MSQESRIEVINREGWRKEYPLQKGIVYIGSAPTNDIILGNVHGAGVAPLHLQLIAAGDGYKLVNLSDQEIFLGASGSEILPPRAVMNLPEGMSLRLGEFTLIFRGGAGVNYGGANNGSGSSNIGLRLALPYTRLAPNQTLVGTATIRNLGGKTGARFDVVLEGLDEDCFDIEPGPLLSSGAEKDISFRLYHHGTRPLAGEWTFVVRATSGNAYPGEQAQVFQTIEILPLYNHRLQLLPAKGIKVTSPPQTKTAPLPGSLKPKTDRRSAGDQRSVRARPQPEPEPEAAQEEWWSTSVVDEELPPAQRTDVRHLKAQAVAPPPPVQETPVEPESDTPLLKAAAVMATASVIDEAGEAWGWAAKAETQQPQPAPPVGVSPPPEPLTPQKVGPEPVEDNTQRLQTTPASATEETGEAWGWAVKEETQQPQPAPPVVVFPPPESQQTQSATPEAVFPPPEPVTPRQVEPEPAQVAYSPEETEPPVVPSTRALPPEPETEAFRSIETEAAPVAVASPISQPEEVQPSRPAETPPPPPEPAPSEDQPEEEPSLLNKWWGRLMVALPFVSHATEPERPAEPIAAAQPSPETIREETTTEHPLLEPDEPERQEEIAPPITTYSQPTAEVEEQPEWKVQAETGAVEPVYQAPDPSVEESAPEPETPEALKPSPQTTKFEDWWADEVKRRPPVEDSPALQAETSTPSEKPAAVEPPPKTEEWWETIEVKTRGKTEENPVIKLKANPSQVKKQPETRAKTNEAEEWWAVDVEASPEQPDKKQ